MLVSAPDLGEEIGGPGGAVYLYLGGPSGLPTSPAWMAYGQTSRARFGAALAGVGDLDRDGFDDVRPLAQALSMELHAWWLRALRRELIARIRMSREELDLLRHEDSGHGSKAIARALGTQAKTIDCRFQRINAKLGAPNRKAAVRIARLYGLL